MYRLPLLIILNSLLLASCSIQTTKTSKVKPQKIEKKKETQKKRSISNAKNLEEIQFILANYDLLIIEISRGKGRSLEQYSKLLGISNLDKKLFFKEIKENSEYLSRQEFPYTLYKELRNTLAKNKRFSHLNVLL